MNRDQHVCKIGKYAKGLIHKKAKQLIGRVGFTQSDLEDIQQDLYVKLLKHLAAFDANLAHPNVFITTIVERHVANILRDKSAEKRDHRRVCSLNIIVGSAEDGAVELSDTVSDREDNARRCRSSRSLQEQTEMRIDIAEHLGKLAEELNRVCKRLMAGDSVSQISRDIGIPRTTLQDRIRKLRDRFEEDGLKDYL